MKIDAFAYFNTTGTDQNVVVTLKDPKDGREIKGVIKVRNGELLNDSKIKVSLGANSRAIITSAVTEGGGLELVGSKGFANVDSLLKKSVILDIETTGRLGSDSIVDIAVFDFKDKSTTTYTPKLQAIVDPVKKGESSYRAKLSEYRNIQNDATRRELQLAEALQRKNAKYEKMSLKNIIKDLRSNKALQNEAEDYIIKTDKFQALQIVEDESKLIKAGVGVDPTDRTKLDPHVKAKRDFIKAQMAGTLDEDAIREHINASGYDAAKVFKGGLVHKSGLTVAEIMSQELAPKFADQVVWIANANFESAQFGSQIEAEANLVFEPLNKQRKALGKKELTKEQFKKAFFAGELRSEIDTLNKSTGNNYYTNNPFARSQGGVSTYSGRPFYLTDPRFSLIKADAIRSGDYSSIYEATLKYTKGGDTRDILDLVRSQQSSLINMGVINEADLSGSVGIEIQSRLYGYTRALKEGKSIDEAIRIAQTTKELHTAAADTSISERLVLEETLEQNEAIRQVTMGTDVGEELKRQALKGEGAYFRALEYGSLIDAISQGEADSAVGGKSIHDVQVEARAGRNLLDLVEGKGVQERTYKPGYALQEQITINEDGSRVVRKVPKLTQSFKHSFKFEALKESFLDLPEYKNASQETKDRLVNDIKGFFDEATGELDPNKRDAAEVYARRLSESASDQISVIQNRVANKDYLLQKRRDIKSQIRKETIKSSKITVDKTTKSRSKLKLLERVTESSPAPRSNPPLSPSGSSPTPPSSPTSRTPANYGPDGSKGGQRINLNASAGLEEVVSASRQGRLIREYSDPQMNVKNATTLYDDIASLHKKAGRSAIFALGGIILTTAASSMKEEKKGGILLPSYSEFIEKKSKEFGSKEEYINSLYAKYGGPRIEGMSESGIGPMLRKLSTDFGSPYQGPGYSSSVLEDYNLRRERSRYISRQFGIRHFSEEGDIGLFFKMNIDSFFRKQYKLDVNSRNTGIPGGAIPVSGEKYGIKGEGLIEYDLSNTNLSVSDADTFSFQFQGKLGTFMGSGNTASFRLAGIDAPETAHESRKAQPYAEQAKLELQRILSEAKEVKAVVRKGDTTYGRQVAMLYADGRNVNLELIKRGAAAFLPYRSKNSPPLFNNKSFSEAQKKAAESNRGMWASPYFKAYNKMIEAGAQTVTFNTLVNPSKVAKNTNLMSMYAMMNQADKMGFINTAMEEELAAFGKSLNGKQKPYAPTEKESGWGDVDLQTYGKTSNSIMSLVDQQKYETGSLMRTRGSQYVSEKYKTTKVNRNNVEMSRKLLSKETYAKEVNSRVQENQKIAMLKERRIKTMEALQQSALRNQFNSPINHTRM